jgi:hypothetical protein
VEISKERKNVAVGENERRKGKVKRIQKVNKQKEKKNKKILRRII